MLPRETEYKISSIPAEVSTAAYVSRAVNGSAFTAGQQIQVNLIQSRGTYIVPNSMYCSFTFNVTAGAADNTILGLPAVSAFSRSDVFANSTSIDTVNNYNAITNILYNGKLSVAQKMGLSKSLGNTFTEDEANQVDSRTVTGGAGAQPFSCAAPMCNVIANSDKLIPLDSAEYRVYLTVDDIANIACLSADGAATTLTNFNITNFQIHYKAVTFDGVTDAMIKSQVQPKDGAVYFKTESYQSSVANLPAASSGSVAFPFANSLTSIKSLMCGFARTDRYKLGSGAAYNPNFGQLNWEVAGKNYPQTPYSSDAVAVVPLEFLESIHGIMSSPDAAHTSMSVNNFRAIGVAQDADNLKDLPKVYFGYNAEKLPSSTALNGISSQNSNIVLRLSINAATEAASTVLQVFHHDVIMKFDPLANTLVVMR
jgi:hypothetical protein